jgi:cytochrome P450
MTTERGDDPQPTEADAAAPSGCPMHADHPTPLYGSVFAADPHATYAKLREHGPFAPVELAPGVTAVLTIGYEAALEVLRDDRTFLHDPRRWQDKVPPDSPVLPMMAYRPNCMFTDGTVHARLRGAVTDVFARVDTTTLRGYVERNADNLVRTIGPAGEADLLKDYASVLPLLVFTELFGCPPDIAQRLVYGQRGIFDGHEAEKANAALTEGVQELIALKRRRAGADITSWLIAHPARLTDEELWHQLVVLMGGTHPTEHLIANGLRLLLADDRFAGDLSGGSLPVEDALDEVLWTDPPVANYTARYLTRELEFMGTVLPADEPIVISYAAANTDPAHAVHRRTGNRAHLSWGVGPHACPAKNHVRLIASVAIERLLDGLPDIELAVPVDRLEWRPGPFHRALAALPIRFPPVHDLDPSWATGDDDRRPETVPPMAADQPYTPMQPPAGPTGAARRWKDAP